MGLCAAILTGSVLKALPASWSLTGEARSVSLPELLAMPPHIVQVRQADLTIPVTSFGRGLPDGHLANLEAASPGSTCGRLIPAEPSKLVEFRRRLRTITWSIMWFELAEGGGVSETPPTRSTSSRLWSSGATLDIPWEGRRRLQHSRDILPIGGAIGELSHRHGRDLLQPEAP
jgi:hypothetical protein